MRMRSVQPVWVLVPALLFVLLGLAMSFVPSQGPDDCEAYYSSNAATEKRQFRDFGEATWCDPVSRFTLIITVFTGVLAVVSIFQLRGLRQANDVARRSAEAAKVSSDALMSAERPHMVVRELKISGLASTPNPDGKVSLALTYRVQNFGRTPAFPKETAIQMHFVPELPVGLPYLEPTQIRGTTTPNHWWGSEWPTPLQADADSVRRVGVGETNLLCIGYFKYADIFGEPHETRFAYKLVIDAGSDASKHFAAVGPDSYWSYT